MDCPKCGCSGAKEIMLARFPTYLCINSICYYYDSDYVYGAQALTDALDFEWEYQLEDGTYLLPDEPDNLQICLVDD